MGSLLDRLILTLMITAMDSHIARVYMLMVTMLIIVKFMAYITIVGKLVVVVKFMAYITLIVSKLIVREIVVLVLLLQLVEKFERKFMQL